MATQPISNSDGHSQPPPEPAKPTSLKKIEANRRNALRSTGPKTARGKRAVRMNALKHGVLAKAVVIEEGEGKEDVAAFEQLLSSLVDSLQPVGTLEELLVQDIAQSYWRLQRSHRHEVGLIREGYDCGTDMGVLESARERNATNSEYRKLEKHRKLFEKLVAALDGEGDLSADRINAIVNDLPLKYPLENTCRYIAGIQAYEQQLMGEDGKPRVPVSRLAYLRERAWYEAVRHLVEFRDRELRSCQMSARFARLQLPRADETENMLRYETTIRRQLERAMDQLERRQRLRKGDFVPAPVRIHLEGRK